MEKCVLMQLEDHLTLNGLHADHQSAYKKGYSCETLLLKVVNDILLALEHQELNALLLLDLSAAFDTVDHQLLNHYWRTDMEYMTQLCYGIKII